MLPKKDAPHGEAHEKCTSQCCDTFSYFRAREYTFTESIPLKQVIKMCRKNNIAQKSKKVNK